MDTEDIVHVIISQSGGTIQGKTRLQKTVYFTLLLAGEDPADFGYVPHYYGPYSAEVANATGALRELGFLSQDIKSSGAVDSSGFEVARHDFHLTPEGREVAAGKIAKNKDYAGRLSEALKKLSKCGGHVDYVGLSIAAKTYFMLGKKQSNVTMDKLAEMAKEFGWSVSRHQVETAAEYLGRLGLVTVTPVNKQKASEN